MGPYYDTRLLDEIGRERLTGLTSDAPGDNEGITGYGLVVLAMVGMIAAFGHGEDPKVENPEPELALVTDDHSSLP
ncbi:MAG: hypothetical protein AB8B85_01005 [Paracoccaceae bacterium]